MRGTLIHTKWENLARQTYGNDVEIEQSFIGGRRIKVNDAGSIRVDLIVKSPEEEPIGIFDLKTGKAGLTPGRINKIRSKLPKELRNLPIIEIRPQTN